MTTGVSVDVGGQPSLREKPPAPASSPGDAGPLALSIDDLPGPAFVLEGPDGRVSAHNAAFGAWAGRADAVGLALTDLLPGDPGAPRLWQEARSAGASEHHVERRGPEGETSFWSLHARRTPSGVLVCATDLTALAGAAQAVHATSRDYVAVAAHELRAPLSAIKAWASALDPRRAPSGASEAEGLGAIARQVDRMNDLLTDLFDAARAGSGTLRACGATVAVGALLHRFEAAPRGPRLAPRGDLDARVFVDAAQIEALVGRVLGWLAARDRSPSLPIEISTEGDEIHLAFLDRGPALSRRAESDLFGRGLRGGRGLGLYLCQQIAAVNGARIWRETGAGAPRVVLALPTAPPSAGAGARLGPPHLLVGELDPALRERIVAVLRLEGHEVLGAPDPASFARALDDRSWNVVVTDPGALGGGEAAATALPRIRARAAAVVVIAPSSERPESLDGAERAGALGVLCRPLDWPHLVSLVGCAAAAAPAYRLSPGSAPT